MLQVITAKWTPEEIALMDLLVGLAGAANRSHLLQIALLSLASDQDANRKVTDRAATSRLQHPHKGHARGGRPAASR